MKQKNTNYIFLKWASEGNKVEAEFRNYNDFFIPQVSYELSIVIKMRKMVSAVKMSANPKRKVNINCIRSSGNQNLGSGEPFW